MKTFFCVKNTSIDLLKDLPVHHRMSKIINKFSPPKSIIWREFSGVADLTYVEINTELRLARLFDTLMNKELFESSFYDLDHYKMFQEYSDFNRDFVSRLGSLSSDDIVVVNDSSLLLIPSMTPARVVFRNLRFAPCFIEKVPFYLEIMKNLCAARKFFASTESLEAFKSYMNCSYDMRGIHMGGCWFIRSYVDKFMILYTMKQIKQYCTDGGMGVEDGSLQRYLRGLTIPKTRKAILVDAKLNRLEPYIRDNLDVEIRYLRDRVEINEETERMIQYLNKMYCIHLGVADVTDYAQLVAEIFYCDVLVGSRHREIAEYFGKAVVEESSDPYLLSKRVREAKAVSGGSLPVGEEAYLQEFFKAIGYDTVIQQVPDEDRAIEKIIKEIKQAQRHEEVYQKISSGELYTRRVSKSDGEATCTPILRGEETKEINPKELREISRDRVREHWRGSNRCVLLDYDGTLTPIVEDPDRAVPPQRAIEVLKKLSKRGRVVICTGRCTKKVDEWIPSEIEVYAEHGACHRVNGEWKTKAERSEAFTLAKEVMEYYQKRTPGTFIEEKATGLTFHYRQAEEFCVDKLYTLLRKIGGGNVDIGKMVVELKGAKKDQVAKAVKPAICIGDDKTDEDMFRSCDGISVRVGQGTSFASGYVESVDACLDLLEMLADE